MWYSTPFKSDELYHHGVKGMRWGVRRYVDTNGKLTPEGKKRYFSKKGKMKLRGWVPRRNLDAFDEIIRKHATSDIDARKKLQKKWSDLHKWAKDNNVNEDDYVDGYYRESYLKTGLGYWGDPSGHKLPYRKKVVEYSNRFDRVSDEEGKERAKDRAYARNIYRDKLQFGKYTLQDYEHDIERKIPRKK